MPPYSPRPLDKYSARAHAVCLTPDEEGDEDMALDDFEADLTGWASKEVEAECGYAWLDKEGRKWYHTPPKVMKEGGLLFFRINQQQYRFCSLCDSYRFLLISQMSSAQSESRSFQPPPTRPLPTSSWARFSRRRRMRRPPITASATAALRSSPPPPPSSAEGDRSSWE